MTTICKKYKSGSFIEKRGEQEDALCLKRFNGSKGGQAFSLRRPAFRAGAIEHDTHIKPLLPNSREGLGNRGITRSNFEAPSIRGREALNFERLQAQDISEGGIKVQLGDKTIEKLFKIQVDDPSDIEWITEKNRRLALGATPDELKNMPPLGRPQRKISQMRNIGQASDTMDDQIEVLKNAVLQGNADNRVEMAQLMASVAGLLGNLGNLRNITQTGMNNLRQVIARMNVPKHWRAAGFTHRLFNWQQYQQQSGLINLFLLSNLGPDRTLEQSLITMPEAGAQNQNPTYRNLNNMRQLLNARGGAQARPGKFLDLQTKSAIPRSAAIALVNGGVDNGQLGGANPPVGGWV